MPESCFSPAPAVLRLSSHYVKSVGIRSFSGPCFPAVGLNTERYGTSLRIQSECGKIKARKTPSTGTFHIVSGIKESKLVWIETITSS